MKIVIKEEGKVLSDKFFNKPVVYMFVQGQSSPWTWLHEYECWRKGFLITIQCDNWNLTNMMLNKPIIIWLNFFHDLIF